MKKVIEINGMSCGHCQAKVEKALNSLEGVQARVNLNKKQATVTLSKEITDEELKNTVETAGYEVVSIKEKKGFLGI